jgi:hypothetical protein
MSCEYLTYGKNKTENLVYLCIMEYFPFDPVFRGFSTQESCKDWKDFQNWYRIEYHIFCL